MEAFKLSISGKNKFLAQIQKAVSIAGRDWNHHWKWSWWEKSIEGEKTSKLWPVSPKLFFIDFFSCFDIRVYSFLMNFLTV